MFAEGKRQAPYFVCFSSLRLREMYIGTKIAHAEKAGNFSCEDMFCTYVHKLEIVFCANTPYTWAKIEKDSEGEWNTP